MKNKFEKIEKGKVISNYIRPWQCILPDIKIDQLLLHFQDDYCSDKRGVLLNLSFKDFGANKEGSEGVRLF